MGIALITGLNQVRCMGSQHDGRVAWPHPLPSLFVRMRGGEAGRGAVGGVRTTEPPGAYSYRTISSSEHLSCQDRFAR
jgi:hypothetical protein